VALDALRKQKAELTQAQYAQVHAITDYYYLCSNEDERRGINPAHSGTRRSAVPAIYDATRSQRPTG
jgi:hypothetical protein